jgi:iron-sulfur cluster protein
MIDTAQNLKDYKKRLKKALKNKFLRSAMGTFATAYKEAQGRIFEGVDLEGIRRDIAHGKDEALPRLEELYQTFKAKAEAAGVTVHLATTATEANEIIAGIARDHQVKKIVKSKSMTAEETFLNEHLEAEGLEVVETDLGEWIIQLRHEGPSHMVMPAIHLSRQEVADLFTKQTGQPQEADIGNLVKVARRELRKAFLEADMGISGANFAIADTGTLGIITNEGNARLTTTLPRVHVALVGVDKLIPDLHTALRILQVLPRRATGQVITSYVTWITGPNECRPAPGGKKEMHVVFLDNGRLALARDPVFKEALRCIRCGSCANVCPIYSLVGGHNYGHRPHPHLFLSRPSKRPGHRAELPQLPGLQGGVPGGHRSAAPHQGNLLRGAKGRGQAAPEKQAAAPGLKRPPAFSFHPAAGLSGPKTPGPG